MKEFFNRLFATRRVAFYLNLIGLTLAFVIFYILMAEVMWHVGFDRFHKDADRVCQVFHRNIGFDKLHKEWYGEDAPLPPERDTYIVAVMEEIAKSSKQFEATVGLFVLGGPCDLIPTDADKEQAEPIKTIFRLCTPDLFKVFTFDIVEGDTAAIRDSHNVFIPLSLAKKLYGEAKSYIGRRCGVKNGWEVNVAGVYRDFPSNSQLPNNVYQRINEQQLEMLWNEKGNWNHRLYVKLCKGADGEEVSEELLSNSPYLREIASHFTFMPLHDTYFIYEEHYENRVELAQRHNDEWIIELCKRNGSYILL